jgi:putative restriction endonuclease
MSPRVNQIYEEYWKYTAAWTDLNGGKFLDVLRCCVNYFDAHDIHEYTPEHYEDLQNEVQRITQIGDASVRKGINQMVKIGFLLPYLGGYVPEAKEYIDARTERRRYAILSRTVYNHSNFQNSMTEPSVEGEGQIKFLIKTLEEVGYIDKRALISLMTVNLADYPRGYMTADELSAAYQRVVDIDFVERKYNQLGHLMNLLSKLDDLRTHDGTLYFKTDADRLFGSESDSRRNVRDPYLQRVYKSELEDESMTAYQCDTPKCMLEGLAHPVLIASHIKPYSSSNEDEAFDVHNGLLLSKNADSLFDLGYITFNNDGTIVTAGALPQDVAEYIRQYRLSELFINEKRMDYMAFHRAQVFERRFNSSIVRHYVFGTTT